MTTENIRKDTLAFDPKSLSKKKQIQLYYQMVKPRMIEEKMLSLLRQGKISKWFSGIGQEAISVGATAALEANEWAFPMHRNLGVFTTREVPMHRLFAQWQGKPSGFTQGRDRSFHFGTKAYNIWGMISHLGPQLSLAGGVALGHMLSKEQNIAIAFTGDGATSEGEFHEALNVAAVWNLPVIFIIENNGYGLSTPVSEQYACKHLADKGIGYGIPAHRIDGNNVLEVYNTIHNMAKELRQNPHPVLIECETFRMRGHEEASGTKYVPQELMDMWAKKDPIQNYEHYLLDSGYITEEDINTYKAQIKKEIKTELEISYAAEEITVDTSKELADVYALPHINAYKQTTAKPATSPAGPTQKLRFLDAISTALDTAMHRWDNLILMGQDIAGYGGVFKITDGFMDKYGAHRVRNTPLCESAIVGIALGLSMKGYKSMMEMQFGDFATCGFNQIVNNLAKLHYRWGHAADVVIRMPCGAGVGAGPFHSQTNEAWFAHTPGLKVVYPSNPRDAKGLLLAAIEDPNPVIYFEHKALYRTLTDEVPDGYYTTEIGKGQRVKQGDQLSIITYGMGVHWAMEVAEAMGIAADIIDLRSLQPLDYGIIHDTVKATNRAIVLHEDSMHGGFGGEIAAYISEHLFEHLDAPVLRVASLDTPIPFNKALETEYLANFRLKEAIKKILKY